MTRNDAINILKMIEAHGALAIIAKEMAIEALKQPELIRCASCHYYADGHCDMHHMGVSPDDFCSYAVGKYNI